MLNNYLETCVYPESPFGDQLAVSEDVVIMLKQEHGIEICSELPGVLLEEALSGSIIDDFDIIHAKLVQSCRKLCMMWFASEQALTAEREFYSTTLQDAPALFGEDAIKISYHLESFILIARSALDVASGVFGRLLPPPFRVGRYDSFNKLIKELQAEGSRLSISGYFDELRNHTTSWISVVSGHVKGRSLRDKIAHQTEFPIDYAELRPWSEKETAIVWLNKQERLELKTFIETVRSGVIEGFVQLEQLCTESIKS